MTSEDWKLKPLGEWTPSDWIGFTFVVLIIFALGYYAWGEEKGQKRIEAACIEKGYTQGAADNCCLNVSTFLIDRTTGMALSQPWCYTEDEAKTIRRGG